MLEFARTIFSSGNQAGPHGTSLLASYETNPEALEELVARVRSGDRRAEERVVELYGRGVAIILDRHTNGRPEAEDLFQDTFRVGLEKLRRGELREPAKLPGFLAQIARSLAIEHYRKITRRKTDADSDAVLEAVAPSEGPLGNLLARENAMLVRGVLQELANERDRQILLRFYIAEEDKDRISADYGLSSLQFNRVLHRARQRYKELMVERLGGGTQAARVAGAIILILITLWRGVSRGGGV
ncbi:MAG TPA: sigma-70 family RNA polymerase sigma factor [Thermoanaerobaculia bacterium]|nr:sigma-70 family RNA polymerase sigma factor [Thermoanaerobaculia bacterium]